MLFDLRGKVALVTGATIGVGKGIAQGLGEAGATVYVTGRRTDVNPDDWIPGSVHQTADEVTQMGGRGIGVRCDHAKDEDVEALFQQIRDEQGRLDILVNNVWGGYENMMEDGKFTWEYPFWEQPLWRWEAMFDAGARAHFTTSRLAAPLMVAQRDGVIVNISFWAAQKFLGNAIYGASKAATDKLAKDMAHDLRDYNVAVISLYPGLVRTEGVLRSAEFFDMSNSESPQFIGRVVAGFALDPKRMEKSGQVLVAAALAQEYGFTDIDGKQPRPITLEEA